MADEFDPALIVSGRPANGAVGGVANGGAAGGVQIRVSGGDFFSDDGQTVDTDGRPNPRTISNTIFKQSDANGVNIDKPNEGGFSSLLWVWGQFLDHDLDQTVDGAAGGGTAPIAIPQPDPVFPASITQLNFNRSVPVDGTGSGGVAREYANQITSFIDASMVYGSSQTKLNALIEPGTAKLKLSATGTILFNQGESTPIFGNGFVAGDTRAGENVALLSMQALFAREHNRIVDEIEAANTSLSTTQVFNAARARVEAIVQAITYNEFLPALIGEDALTAYSGFKSNVNPAISLEFSTAIFRLGHTLLSPTISRMNEDGTTAISDLALRDAFGTRGVVEQTGIEAILRGMSTTKSQELDTFMVEDVRSFLFNTGQGTFGSDLASLNIQRGRDHGLPSYMEMRAALNLPTLTDFSQISSDPDIVAKLRAAYGNDLSKIDLWVGGLAEDSVGGGMVGETFRLVLIDQFTRLRDGDPFWSAIREFSQGEEDTLWSTTLSDVIKRNSNVVDLQDDAFLAYLRKAGGAGADTLTGTVGERNLIIGNAGDDTLTGAEKQDYLVGGAGADRLIAHGGENVLEGGADGDTYVFDVTVDSYNTIRGWQSIDAFQFLNTAGVPQLVVTDEPEGATITFGEAIIVVEGVLATDLPFTTNPGGNTPPSVVADSGAVPVNGSGTINVLSNDSDNGALDPTSVLLVNADAGSNGRTKTVAGQGVWTVNPSSGVVTFAGVTGFTGAVTPAAYTVADTAGLRSTVAAIAVTLTGGLNPGQTLNGSNANDTQNGGAGNDTINGSGGDDTINGAAGADTINGGTGVDNVNGGDGNDLILISGNQAQTDTMDGGGGLADTIRVLAAGGNVIINSTNRISNVEIFDGAGRSVVGTSGADTLNFSGFAAVTGVASINGLGGADTITGTAGADVLIGGGGADTLIGLAGDDRLTGGSGVDVISGGDGDDIIFIRANAASTDTMNGGAGVDRIRLDSTSADIVLSGTSRISGIEIFEGGGRAVLGTGGADVFDFTIFDTVTGVASIQGLGGNDTILGSAGADVILGGDGADTLNGGPGADRLTGGTGNDTFRFVAGLTSGVNTITDFDAAGNDVLRFVGYDFGSATTGAQRAALVGQATTFDAGGATIDLADLGGAGTARLLGVNTATLVFASEDIVFG